MIEDKYLREFTQLLSTNLYESFIVPVERVAEIEDISREIIYQGKNYYEKNFNQNITETYDYIKCLKISYQKTIVEIKSNLTSINNVKSKEVYLEDILSTLEQVAGFMKDIYPNPKEANIESGAKKINEILEIIDEQNSSKKAEVEPMIKYRYLYMIEEENFYQLIYNYSGVFRFFYFNVFYKFVDIELNTLNGATLQDDNRIKGKLTAKEIRGYFMQLTEYPNNKNQRVKVLNEENVEHLLDTLAQSGTAFKSRNTKTIVMVSGNGSDLTNEKLQRGRGKRKIITQVLALSLIKVAEEKGENEMVKALWNTYYCQRKIYVSGFRAYSKPCKNRFCTVCLSNKKADIINRYLPELKTWDAPFFLTLTMKSVTAGLIKHQIKIMKKALRSIIGKYKKRNQRGKGIKLKGITSMECNFNPKEKTYNVHFHLILPNLKISDTIMTEWLLYWNNKELVTKGAQCNKRIKKLNDGLIEVIKYGTKIFTVQDVKKKLKGKGKEKIYAAAFYNIVKAMREERIFERFGFNLPKADKSKIVKNKELTDYKEFEYNPQLFDWQNNTTGERLSKHLPSDELIKYLFSDRIDMILE